MCFEEAWVANTAKSAKGAFRSQCPHRNPEAEDEPPCPTGN